MSKDRNSSNFAPIKPPMPQHKLTLRTKGIWLLVVFIIFTITTGWIIGRERDQLLYNVQKLQAVHMSEEGKLGLYLSVARAVMVVNENFYEKDVKNSGHLIAMEINAVLSGLSGLKKNYPVIAKDIEVLQKNLIELDWSPNQATFSNVRNNLHKIFLDVNSITTQNIAKEGYWLDQYFNTFNRLFLEWTLFAVVGVVALSSLVMIFVTRLAWDIRRAQDRTIQIVKGYRGKPMKVSRNDELGSLMRGINWMQHELRHREVQAELNRQQQFYAEKMAAVGSLAAVVAHEINNPLSAIVGLSQEMTDMINSKQCNGGNGQCRPELLLAHAQRIMNITHQISEFATPQSAEPKLLDINNLIRNTVSFVSFDRRFRSIDMALSLDPQLPAIYAVGDHITQVLMNLLFNSADAAADRIDKKTRIDLTTRSDEKWAIITLADNGPGIEPAILNRVFEEFFTTKPPGKGTGIGLALSKSLIESSGGSINIESKFGSGTTVTIRLPLKTTVVVGTQES